MIHITPGVAVRSLLKQGCMVKAGPDSIFKSHSSHCVILLNSSPLTDDYLIFVSTTSQYEKRIEFASKVGLPPSSIIMFRPGTYYHLPKYTAVDCNSIHTMTLGVITALYAEEQIAFYKTHPQVSKEHLQQIINGVIASPQVEQEIKNIISPSSL